MGDDNDTTTQDPTQAGSADGSDDGSDDLHGDDGDHWVHFSPTADRGSVSDLTISILRDALEAKNEVLCVIAFANRTPDVQAAAMYDTFEADGVDDWKTVYSAAGQRVIDAYSTAKSSGGDATAVTQAILDQINKEGAENVSRHCVDAKMVNVVDLALSSLDDPDALVTQLKSDSRIAKVIVNDDVIHLEIDQTDSSASAAADASDDHETQASPAGADSSSGATTWGSVSVTWGAHADHSGVSSDSAEALGDILSGAGESSVTVTSTARSPADQARAMFAVLERDGADKWNDVYTAAGQAVIAAYSQAKGDGSQASDIQKAMTDTINQQGPDKVSRHCADASKTNVLDLLTATLKDADAVEQALKGDKRISKVIVEDRVIHIEIAQSGADNSSAGNN